MGFIKSIPRSPIKGSMRYYNYLIIEIIIYSSEKSNYLLGDDSKHP